MMPHDSGPIRRDLDGRQEVDIVVDRGYRPDTIQAQAGVPIRLVFHRLDDDPCFERVVFSAPRRDRHLAESGVTVIDLPGQPPGEVRFTCGLGRYRGRIEISDANAGSTVAAVRRTLRWVEAPLGRAVVLWLGSLPLIALVAILALDTGAALAAAALALVAWVVGCVWALDRAAATQD
ncbi:MAG: cupredoxin domain-containing protein [Candidatus Limnocylindria bacterium]